jgi:hypothetical protein
MFTDDKTTDNYATDAGGWELIRDYIPKDKKIWAPFYCDGKQGEIFTDMGYDIYHKDKDFFSYEPDDYDMIVDNPPFSKFKEVCSRLKELDKPFILILFPKVFLCKWFQDLFAEELQIIIPKKRPTFTHLTNGKKNYTPPFGTFYFCWKMKLDKDLIFI